MVLLILSKLICPLPKLIPAEAFTAQDRREARVAEISCRKTYGPDSCLTKFIKVKERTYYAICTKAKRKTAP